MHRCFPIAIRPAGEQGTNIENKGAWAVRERDGCSIYARHAAFHVRNLRQAVEHGMLWDAASKIS